MVDADSTDTTHQAVLSILDLLLNDFGLSRLDSQSEVSLVGQIPFIELTKSKDLLLSLVGTLPSLANAIAAAQIYEHRGGKPQSIAADLRKGHNYIDPNIGMTPSINGQEITLDLIAGNPFLRKFYNTKDGRYVVPSAVYVDLVYQWSSFFSTSLLEQDVAAAILKWNAQGDEDSKWIQSTLTDALADLEDLCAEAGMPLAIVRSTEEWLSSPQGKHLAEQAIVPVHKAVSSPSKALSPNPSRPLEGIKVLCMTHAIAGPSAGRTLAEHGASVLQIMFTHGFEHNFVYTYANLGCASSRLNLGKEQDRQRLWELVRDADVWIDSFREGGISKFGFEDAKLFEANPSLIVSHVRAYGSTGPWAARPGFDMQGSAVSGMMAHCGSGSTDPQWAPGMVINDYTTGYYGALAIQATLLRRAKEGGGYLLSPSLAGTASSIMKYMKTSDHPDLTTSQVKPLPPDSMEAETNIGYLKTLSPLPKLSGTPIEYSPIFLNAIGSDRPCFPGFEDAYDVHKVQPASREVMEEQLSSLPHRMARLQTIGVGGRSDSREV